MSNVFALRDSLAGLAGDTGAHVAGVAAEFGRAVLLCAQHGNRNPMDAAHEFMGTLKGTSKAVKAVRAGYAAGIAAAGFLVVTQVTLADTRSKGDKKMAAPEALAVALAVEEAFVLAFGTSYNAPAKARAEKPKVEKVDVEALTADRDSWKARAEKAMAEVSALRVQLKALGGAKRARAERAEALPA